MIGDFLNFGNSLSAARRVVTNPLGLFTRNPALAQLSLRFARQHLNFAPNVKLVLELPNFAHLRARVPINHLRQPFFSLYTHHFYAQNAEGVTGAPPRASDTFDT
jgi:hypothetical protein